MSEKRRLIENTCIFLIGSIMIGYLLLVLVYLIPTEPMQPQIVRTAKMMEATETQPKDPYSGRLVDNYADSLTILLAGYPGEENAFDKAASSYYYSIEGEYPRESLVGITLYDRDPVQVPYGRYWHGSMVFIKPLLLNFDLSAMRMINTVVLFLLILIVLALMQRTLPRATIPFGLMMLLIAPTTVGQCFEYTFAVHVMLVTCIMYLWNPKDVFSGNRICYLFLIAGILLAYFDFLTAPTITLAVPLALVCLKEKPSCKKLILCAVFWITGYAGMWAGKWIIALISHGSSFSSLTDHFALWTSERPVNEQQITRIGTLNRNFEKLFEDVYVDIALLCYAAVSVFHALWNRKGITYEQAYKNMALIFPAVIGIAWILVMSRHSYVHTFFTCRTLAPCVFCVLCMLDLGDALCAKGDNNRLGGSS